jgi:DnaK suppressor protein
MLLDRITELYRSVHGDVRAELVSDAVDQDEPRDDGDESLRTELRDLRVRLAETDARRAQQIEEALRRLREGRHGTCLDCDRAIEWKRLRLVPWALRCVDCQELAETSAREHAPTI